VKKDIPEATSKNRSNVSVTQQRIEFRASPFPDPAILEEYNRVNPGFAERIMAMVESESQNRQNKERMSLDAEIYSLRHQHIEIHMGQIFGFSIGIFSIGAGTYCAINGAQLAGALIGSSGVIGLVSVFIMGRSDKK